MFVNISILKQKFLIFYFSTFLTLRRVYFAQYIFYDATVEKKDYRQTKHPILAIPIIMRQSNFTVCTDPFYLILGFPIGILLRAMVASACAISLRAIAL